MAMAAEPKVLGTLIVVVASAVSCLGSVQWRALVGLVGARSRCHARARVRVRALALCLLAVARR
jgi:hypothetical protein